MWFSEGTRSESAQTPPSTPGLPGDPVRCTAGEHPTSHVCASISRVRPVCDSAFSSACFSAGSRVVDARRAASCSRSLAPDAHRRRQSTKGRTPRRATRTRRWRQGTSAHAATWQDESSANRAAPGRRAARDGAARVFLAGPFQLSFIQPRPKAAGRLGFRGLPASDQTNEEPSVEKADQTRFQAGTGTGDGTARTSSAGGSAAGGKAPAPLDPKIRLQTRAPRSRAHHGREQVRHMPKGFQSALANYAIPETSATSNRPHFPVELRAPICHAPNRQGPRRRGPRPTDAARGGGGERCGRQHLDRDPSPAAVEGRLRSRCIARRAGPLLEKQAKNQTAGAARHSGSRTKPFGSREAGHPRDRRGAPPAAGTFTVVAAVGPRVAPRCPITWHCALNVAKAEPDRGATGSSKAVGSRRTATSSCMNSWLVVKALDDKVACQQPRRQPFFHRQCTCYPVQTEGVRVWPGGKHTPRRTHAFPPPLSSLQIIFLPSPRI